MTCDKAKTILMGALREHFPDEKPIVVRVKDGERPSEKQIIKYWNRRADNVED